MREPDFQAWATEMEQAPPGSLAEADLLLGLVGWEAEWLVRLPALLPRLVQATLHPADPAAAERALLLLHRSGLRVPEAVGRAFRRPLLRLVHCPTSRWGRLLLLLLAEGRVEGGREMLLEGWEAWPRAEETLGGVHGEVLAWLVRAAACHEARGEECSSRFVSLALAEMQGHRLPTAERERVVGALAQVAPAYRREAFARAMEAEAGRSSLVLSAALPHLSRPAAERLFQHWRKGPVEAVRLLLEGLGARGDWRLAPEAAAALLGSEDARIRLGALRLLDGPATFPEEGASCRLEE